MNISPEQIKKIVLEVSDFFQTTDNEEDFQFLNENFFLTEQGEEFFNGIRNTYEFVSKG